MFRKFIMAFGLIFYFAQAMAIDLVVQESGPLGTYASISLAVSAANDGDRIIIINRPGGLAWQEDVTINKSLELLPSVDGTRFLVHGNYTISPSSAGKQIRIIGMENISGSILANADAPTGTRTKVEIAGCDLLGNIDFYRSYFDMLIAGNELIGEINIRYGNIYGNQLPANKINVNDDASSSNDILNIIGNECEEINWYSSSQFFNISNNHLRGDGYLIYVNDAPNSSLINNTIVNNSIRLTSTGTAIRITASASPNGKVDILNNAIDDNTGATTYGLYRSGNVQTYFAYNHVDFSLSYEITGFTNNGTNVINTSFTIATNGDPGLVNLGSPAKAYYDHDLTRNNPGCYGGSFNFNNYRPLTAGPHVFHMVAPRAIFQGNTISIEAEGFDR